MTKTPFIVLLKNVDPVLVFTDVEQIEPDNIRAAVLDELPTGVNRKDVLQAVCMCPVCQVKIAMQLEVLAHTVIPFTDARWLLKFVPVLEGEDNPLKENWEQLQHLVMGLSVMQTHLKAFLSSVEQRQERLTKP